jgi:hypothetical protein
MAGFHGIKVSQIARRLERELQPAVREHLEAAVKATEEYLEKALSKPYVSVDQKTGKITRQASKSFIRPRGRDKHGNIIWGKSWGKSQGASKTEYPRRRTGSLQSSVGHRKIVQQGNIYSILFGINRNNFQGKAATKHRAAKKWEAHRKAVNEWLRTGRNKPEAPTEKPTKPPTKVTLYAKYLEEGTNKMRPRKLVRAAWEDANRIGLIKDALKELKGKGSRIARQGHSPRVKFFQP